MKILTKHGFIVYQSGPYSHVLFAETLDVGQRRKGGGAGPPLPQLVIARRRYIAQRRPALDMAHGRPMRGILMNPSFVSNRKTEAVLVLLVASVAILAAVSLAAESDAASGNCGEKLTWTLEGDKLTISGSGSMYDYTDTSAPWGPAVAELVVEDKPYNIGRYAFSGSTALTSISLGSVEEISEGAFYGCTALTSVTIPNNVKYISNMAFMECTGLKDLEIGDRVISIGEQAFSGCTSLVTASIGNYVETIDDEAFSGDHNLVSVTFGDRVKYIESRAFYRCTSLTSLRFPDSIRGIMTEAFKDDRLIESVYFGTDLVAKSPDSFTVEFQDKNGNVVTNPLQLAGRFYKQGSINNVLVETDPEQDQKCGDDLTWSMSRDKLTISGTGDMYDYGSSDAPWGRTVTEIVFEGTPTSIGERAFSRCPIRSLAVPDSVTVIGDDAFKNCESLQSLSLGSSLRTIGGYAFSECKSLTSVVIPDSVRIIDDSAFSYCSALSSLKLGSSVSTIGDGAFSNCPALTSVDFPDSVIRIYDIAFKYDNAIRHVSFGSGLDLIIDDSFSVEFQDKNGKKVVSANDLRGHTYEGDSMVLREIASEPVHPSGVSLDKKSATMQVGKSLKLTATVSPAGADDKSITWSSDNTKVATVDKDGNVKAVSEGKATITVTTNDGGKTDSCAVTVTAAPAPGPSPSGSGSDNTMLYVGIAVAIVVLALLAFLFMRSRSKV